MGEAQGGGSRAKAEANHISERPEENSGRAEERRCGATGILSVIDACL